MYDIYRYVINHKKENLRFYFILIRTQITEPSFEDITERLNKHPYINFCQDLSEETIRI